MAIFGGWIFQHGYEVLSAVGIIAGLVYTGASFRADTRSRRLSNLVKLTQQHRDIWEEMQGKSSLSRIKEVHVDLYTKPISLEEAQFVVMLLLHLHCWYRAIIEGEVRTLDGLTRDMKAFFSRSIPAKIWQERRAFFDTDFVDFVERSVGLK